MRKVFLIFLSILTVTSCNFFTKESFQKVSPGKSGIHFINSLTENDSLNYLKFPYMYMGGGVAVGDINNDGYPDLLVGNYNGGVAFFRNDSSYYLANKNQAAVVRSSFTIYPNPASDELHLNFYHAENEHAYIEMLNSIGQLIYKAPVNEQSMTLPLNSFADGIYLLRFIADNNRQSSKLIVRKR